MFGLSANECALEPRKRLCLLTVPLQSDEKFTFSHHGPAVSRFLVSNGSTNGAGCLRGCQPKVSNSVFQRSPIIIVVG